ncbi:hypothetical protein LIHA111178_04370 [Litorimonas haliclonae]
MITVLKSSLFTLSAAALLICTLLAWGGFELELNMGSGSLLQAAAWSFGITIFGVLSALGFYFLGKAVSFPSNEHSRKLLFSACLMCLLFAALVMLVGRNVGAVLILFPIGACAFALPIIAYIIIRKAR